MIPTLEEILAKQERKRNKNSKDQKDYFEDNPRKYMLIVPRRVAKRDKLPFTITEDDIVIPATCPVSGLPIIKGSKPRQPTSPSLEMLDPKLGYVPGNVRVVAYKATNARYKTKQTGMKLCPRCGDNLPISAFYELTTKDPDGDPLLSGICIECSKAAHSDWHNKNSEIANTAYNKWRQSHPETVLVRSAKKRAQQRGLPCTITEADIVIPDVCPVLGIPFERGTKSRPAHGSPSLDCFEPALGYIPGNVSVISHRANTIKNNASLEEIEKLVFWMQKETEKREQL
jgi:hypothetical protein